MITAIDRYGRESLNSSVFSLPDPAIPVLVSPSDLNTTIRSNDSLKWMKSDFSNYYILEIAKDSDFTIPVGEYILSDTLFSLSNLNLPGESTYFWRVSGGNLLKKGVASEPFEFTTAYPASVVFISPVHLDTKISLQPEITFDVSNVTDEVSIQISEGGTAFNDANLVYDKLVTSTGSHLVNDITLKEYTTHYLRIKAFNTFGESSWAGPIQFKTLMPVPEITEITTPEDQAHLAETTRQITIEWLKAAGSTFHYFEAADNPEFSSTLVSSQVFSVNSYTFSVPATGISYYFRVAGANVGGLGPWSPVVQVIIDEPLAVDNSSNNNFKIYPNPVNDDLHIEITNPGNINTIQIVNLQGKIMMSRELVSSSEEVDVSPLKPGVYLIRIIDEKGGKFLKFIKE